MNGFDVAVVAPDRQVIASITDLVDRVSAERDHAALGEHKRMELDHLAAGPGAGPGRAGPMAMVVARQDGRPVGYAHLSATPAAQDYAVELVVDAGAGPGISPSDGPPSDDRMSPPAAATTGGRRVADALLRTAVDHVAAEGGGMLRLWVPRATAADEALATAHGFELERELIQMRCPLPRPTGLVPRGTPVQTRPFRPGVDEEAWVAVNNRAFGDHPEQGHWDLATVLEREQEPWFDPEGFLLMESEGHLVGSCWTKVHSTTIPPLGEIYVIGVDPDYHGRGWGRALTAAGLDWLAARGLAVGMLYVDADNRPAVSLYRSMGFEPDHVDRAYRRAVAVGLGPSDA